MSQSLFREVSLEKLSFPEQLDELIKVTSPRAWLALIAIGCILLSAIIWGFFGKRCDSEILFFIILFLLLFFDDSCCRRSGRFFD